MALTTRISEDAIRDMEMFTELRRAGLHHLKRIRHERRIHDWRVHWAWLTASGGKGDFITEDYKPTPEELTAMFAAIKLTD